MGLFDDLLKKPKNEGSTPAGQGSILANDGGTPPANDPLAISNPIIKIEKTSEASIVTEKPVLANTPAPVTVSAIDDSSSILVGSGDAPTLVVAAPETPVIISSEESISSPIIAIDVPAAPTTPVAPIQETPDLSHLFGEASPSIVDTVMIPSEQKTDEAPIATLSQTPIVESPEVSSLIIPEASAIISPEVSSSIVSETPTEEVQSSPISDLLGGEDSLGGILSTSAPVSEGYEHPSDFVDASIQEIDVMIEKIDTAHNAKLAEALEYKTEKEKYSDLEDQAYTDANTLVEEKDHALSMREYFVKQKGTSQENVPEASPLVSEEGTAQAPIMSETALDAIVESIPQEDPVETPSEVASVSNTPSSIETTLTGLAVANAVSETVAPVGIVPTGTSPTSTPSTSEMSTPLAV